MDFRVVLDVPPLRAARIEQLRVLTIQIGSSARGLRALAPSTLCSSSKLVEHLRFSFVVVLASFNKLLNCFVIVSISVSQRQQSEGVLRRRQKCMRVPPAQKVVFLDQRPLCR